MTRFILWAINLIERIFVRRYPTYDRFEDPSTADTKEDLK